MWKVTNDSVLWKGEDIGDNIKETTSKFQQFYIRMWLQHGELEDTDLKASASTQGILSSGAWAALVPEQPRCRLQLGLKSPASPAAAPCWDRGCPGCSETQHCAKIGEGASPCCRIIKHIYKMRKEERGWNKMRKAALCEIQAFHMPEK